MIEKVWVWRMFCFSFALVLFVDAITLWTEIVSHFRLPSGFRLAELMMTLTTWRMYRKLRQYMQANSNKQIVQPGFSA
jgi:hypothetical protein